MLQLTVATDPGFVREGTNILVSDVLYIKKGTKRDRLLVHTFHGVYYMIGSLIHWVSFLNENGYKFIISDRSHVLNVEKVKIVDSFYKDAYFECDTTKMSKKCPITHYRFTEVAIEMLIMNPGIIINGAAVE